MVFELQRSAVILSFRAHGGDVCSRGCTASTVTAVRYPTVWQRRRHNRSVPISSSRPSRPPRSGIPALSWLDHVTSVCFPTGSAVPPTWFTGQFLMQESGLPHTSSRWWMPGCTACTRHALRGRAAHAISPLWGRCCQWPLSCPRPRSLSRASSRASSQRVDRPRPAAPSQNEHFKSLVQSSPCQSLKKFFSLGILNKGIFISLD